jgi:hypothetical protein
MDIVVLILLIYAAKSALEDAKAAWRRSKAGYMASAGRRFPDASKSRRTGQAIRHDAGYWSGQAAHGFPVVRHGFAQGWHAGRAEQFKAREGREDAAANHLETRARVKDAIEGHRKRQQAALTKLREAREAGEGSRETAPLMAVAKKAVTTAVQTAAGIPPVAGQSTNGPAASPSGGVPGKEAATGPVNGQAAPEKQNGSSEEGSKGNPAAPQVPQQPAGRHERPQEQRNGTTGGTPMAGDVTYDQVIADMTRAQADAEGKHAEARQAMNHAGNLADQMQALDVDSGTVSSMMDHLDAHRDAEKAHLKVQETADSVLTNLKRHQQLSEAHKDSPVQAADKEFYQE